MSDYISKSAVLEIIDKEIDKEVSDVHQFIVHNTQLAIRHATLKLPTLDEKEIIRKLVERIIKRFEEEIKQNPDASLREYRAGLYKAIEIAAKVGGIE